MSLYGDVKITYEMMHTAVQERFGIGEDRLGTLCYDPRLVPVYGLHRQTLEVLFQDLLLNPRNSPYYLAVCQLHDRGYWTNIHRANQNTLPALPSLEVLIAVPSM